MVTNGQHEKEAKEKAGDPNLQELELVQQKRAD